MDKYFMAFVNGSKLPSRDFSSYALICFFVSCVLGLIASIISVAANFLVALASFRFLGFTQGICLVSGLALVFTLVRWRSVIRQLHRKMAEKFPNYAAIALKMDETMVNLGIAIAAAGLIINLFVVFGFVVVVVGLALAYHFFFKSMKDFEGEEAKFLSSIVNKEMRSFNFSLDTNTLLYMMITLFGYAILHQEDWFNAVEDYVNKRRALLEEVTK
ncbi:MAG: hypothetical protein WHT65_09725 [Pseudothermotoga sp.]